MNSFVSHITDIWLTSPWWRQRISKVLQKYKTKAFWLFYHIVQWKTSLWLADRHMTQMCHPQTFLCSSLAITQWWFHYARYNSHFQPGHASSVGFGYHGCNTQNRGAQAKHSVGLLRHRGVWKAAVRSCMHVGCQEKLGWCQSNYLVHQSFRKYTEKPKTRCWKRWCYFFCEMRGCFM